MRHFSYKETKNRSKELAHFLSKRDKSDLLFEHVKLDNGYFEGYTIKGEPFFGELLLGDNYSFGLFDKKGFYYGIRLAKDKPLQYGDAYNGGVIIFDETKKDNEIRAYKLKNGLVGSEISCSRCESPLFSALYLKGEDGYLRRFLPSDIECARFLKSKNECFFGSANKKSPTGYGVYIDFEHDIFALGNISSFGKNSFTLADDSPAIGYFDNKLHIMYKKIILSFYDDGDHSIFKIAKRPIPCSRGYVYPLSLNTFPSITIEKDRYKELVSTSEQYEQYEQLDSSETDNGPSSFFAVEEPLLPIQFGLSLIDRLYNGDVSLIMKVFDRIDSSLLATSKKDIENCLIKGEFDEEAFVKHVKEVKRQRIKEQKELEQKEKEERKRKREEERAKHPQKKRLTKEEREELERQKDLEWFRRNYELNMKYSEKRTRENANVSYNPERFKSNLGIVGYGGFLQRTSVFNFIKRACPMIANGLDYGHTSICVDIDESSKTATATIDISCNKPVANDYARDLQTGFINEMEKAGLEKYLPGYRVDVVVKYKTLVKRNY